MEINPKFLKDQIRSELSGLTDNRLITQLSESLVEPTRIYRGWDYGEPDQQYPCWTIFAHARSDTGIAYCEYGFGPQFPWGLVSATDNEISMGMDSEWFKSFLTAYLDSFAPTYLDVWRVFKTEKGEYPVPVTSEAGWDDTWVQVMKMRELQPEFDFDCKCDAEIELSMLKRTRNKINL